MVGAGGGGLGTKQLRKMRCKDLDDGLDLENEYREIYRTDEEIKQLTVPVQIYEREVAYRPNEEVEVSLYSSGALFVVLSKYLYIYKLPGDRQGVPNDVSNDIIGTLNRYELVLLSTAISDYTTGALSPFFQ